MNKKLRLRILTKMAQAQPTAPAKVIPPPPAVPSVLFSHLNEGFSAATVPLLVQVADVLNTAVHYASDGYDNFQKFINTSFSFSNSATSPEQRDLRGLCKELYKNLLNSGNAFKEKAPPQQIHNAVASFLNSGEFSNLSQVSPTGQLAIKVPNLKGSLQDSMNQIKSQNPITR